MNIMRKLYVTLGKRARQAHLVAEEAARDVNLFAADDYDLLAGEDLL
jgi:hypothetical protein